MESSSSSSGKSNEGLPSGVAPALDNGLMTDQEKKEKERFLPVQPCVDEVSEFVCRGVHIVHNPPKGSAPDTLSCHYF